MSLKSDGFLDEMALDDTEDKEFGGPLVAKLREEFRNDVQDFKGFVRPELPKSLTPADLSVLYSNNEYLASWLWTLAEKTSKWNRYHNEISALLKKRDVDEKARTMKYIVDNASDPFLSKLKSEAQKLQVASDKLDLPGTPGLTYLAELTKGWFDQFKARYERLQRQQDALLTHMGILKSQFSVHPSSGNSS